MTVLWLLLVPLFAFSDRTVGSDGAHPKTTGNLPILVLALALAFSKVHAAAVLSGTWLLYRNLPWSWGGTTTPRTCLQMLGALARHSMPAAAAFGCFLLGWLSIWVAGAFLLYALAATCLGVYYGLYTDAQRQFKLPEDPRVNARIELTRGGLFGLALALTTMGLF